MSAPYPPTAVKSMDAATTLTQIGHGTILGVSGGRWHMEGDSLILPVSNGYRVRVVLNAMDLYDVHREFKRGERLWCKGTWANVYCTELAEVVWQAHAFRNVEAPAVGGFEIQNPDGVFPVTDTETGETVWRQAVTS